MGLFEGVCIVVGMVKRINVFLQVMSDVLENGIKSGIMFELAHFDNKLTY